MSKADLIIFLSKSISLSVFSFLLLLNGTLFTQLPKQKTTGFTLDFASLPYSPNTLQVLLNWAETQFP